MGYVKGYSGESKSQTYAQVDMAGRGKKGRQTQNHIIP